MLLKLEELEVVAGLAEATSGCVFFSGWALPPPMLDSEGMLLNEAQPQSDAHINTRIVQRAISHAP
jgi:hypothetical protein